MDARAMEDHDWDECGASIADLFKADPIKRGAINEAWWFDLDEEEQQDIHEFVCENKRGPDGHEAVQQFEKYAADREKKARDVDEKAKQEKAAAAKGLTDAGQEYAKFKRLLDEQVRMNEPSHVRRFSMENPF